MDVWQRVKWLVSSSHCRALLIEHLLFMRHVLNQQSLLIQQCWMCMYTQWEVKRRYWGEYTKLVFEHNICLSRAGDDCHRGEGKCVIGTGKSRFWTKVHIFELYLNAAHYTMYSDYFLLLLVSSPMYDKILETCITIHQATKPHHCVRVVFRGERQYPGFSGWWRKSQIGCLGIQN